MFRFRLSKVLDYRRLQEKQRQRDMLDKQQQLAQEETCLRSILQQRHRLEAQLSTSQGTALPGHQLQQWREYHQHIAHRVEAQQAVVAEAAKALVLIRQVLLNAQQKKKILEKLRDKVFNNYLQERQMLEQHVLDEIGIMRSQHDK